MNPWKSRSLQRGLNCFESPMHVLAPGHAALSIESRCKINKINKNPSLDTEQTPEDNNDRIHVSAMCTFLSHNNIRALKKLKKLFFPKIKKTCLKHLACPAFKRIRKIPFVPSFFLFPLPGIYFLSFLSSFLKRKTSQNIPVDSMINLCKLLQ